MHINEYIHLIIKDTYNSRYAKILAILKYNYVCKVYYNHNYFDCGYSMFHKNLV